MAATIDALETQWTVNIQKAEAQLAKLEARAKEAAKKVEKSGETMGENFASGFSNFLGKANPGEAIEKIFDRSRLAVFEEGGAKIPVFGAALEALGPIGLSAAAGVAAAGIAIEQARKAMEWSEDIKRLAGTLGTSTTNLQAFDEATISVGVGLERGRASLGDFQERVGKFQAGIGDEKLAKVFEPLGGDALRAKLSGTADELNKLELVLDAIASKPAADRAFFADGLGLGAFKPLLAEGKEGVEKYQKAVEDAKSSGGIVSDEDITKAAELNDHVEVMQHRIGVELNKAFMDVAPVVDRVATFLENVAHAVADISAKIPAAIAGFKSYASEVAKFLPVVSELKIGYEFFTKNQIGKAIGQAVYSATPLGQAQNVATAAKLGFGTLVNQGHKADPSTRSQGSTEGKVDPNIANGAGATRYGSGSGSKGAKGPADRTNEIAKASQAAIDSAIKEELAARLALATDLDQRAKLQADLLESERKAALDNIAGQLKTKKITPQAATTASDTVNKAFDEKSQLAQRQASDAKMANDLAYNDAMRGYQVSELNHAADQAQTAGDWATATRKAFELSQQTENADFLARINQEREKGLTETQAAAEIAAHNAEQARASSDNQNKTAVEVTQRTQAFADQLNSYLLSTLSSESQIAVTAKSRNAIENQILKIKQAQATAALDAQIADKKSNPQYNNPANVAAARQGLATSQKAETDAQMKSQQGALQNYADGLKDLDTQFENIKVDGFKSLEDGFLSIANGTKTVKQAFSEMALSIISDLEKVLVEQALLAAFGLGGAGGGGDGGGVGGLLGKLFHFASGTNSAPGGMSLVGENGLELLSLPQGTKVMNNTATRTALNGAQGGGVTQHNYNLTTNIAANDAVLTPTIQNWIAASHIQAVATARGYASTDQMKSQRKRLK